MKTKKIACFTMLKPGLRFAAVVALLSCLCMFASGAAHAQSTPGGQYSYDPPGGSRDQRITALQNGLLSRRWIYCLGSLSGFSVECSSGAPVSVGTTGTTNPTSTAPAFFTMATSTTVNTVAGDSLIREFAFGSSAHVNNPYGIFKVKISATANVREWVCLTVNSSATQGGSTTPGGDYACFRYDTGAGDTNWMYQTCKAGTCSTATSTGVAADTNLHTFEIVCNDSASNVVFIIDGSVVGTQSTSADLPTDSAQMGPEVTLTNLTAANVTLSIAGYFISAIN